MVHKDGRYISYFILICAIFISSGFAYWLYKETDMEKYIDFKNKSNDLLLYERYEENIKLRNEISIEIFDDEIDLVWLTFVRDEPDGHVKLQLYSRLLAGNPDYEEIYQEISAIIARAPKEYPIDQKTRYMTALKSIRGVRHDLLEEYNLLVNIESK